MPRRKPEQPYFALSVQERIDQRQVQEQAWQNVFIPITADLDGLSPAWLVQGWIPVGTLCILASPPKSGKTSLATALALAVATGTPFAGMPCAQAGVLWMAQEESIWERERLVKASPLADPIVPLFTTYDRLPIDQQSTLDLLSFWVQHSHAKLIVVDPLHGAHSGHSLQDGWAARRTLDPLREFCHSHNVTALVLHHAKSGARGVSGATPWSRVAENDQLAATASINIVLTSRPLRLPFPGSTPVELGKGLGDGAIPTFPLTKRSEVEGGRGEPPVEPDQASRDGAQKPTRLVTLHCTGRGPFANRSLELLSSGPLDYILQDHLPPEPPVQKPRVTQGQAIVRLLTDEGPLTSTAIINRLDLKPESARVLLTRLLRNGEIEVERTKRPRTYKVPARLAN